MTYISDDELAELPEDPDEAFTALVRIVRERYQEEYDQLEDSQSVIPLQRRYVNIILPAARHYGISSVAGWERTPLSKGDWKAYDAFIDDVDFCVSELRLKNTERTKQHSVALNKASRAKLQHLVKQIRATIDKLDISVAKKERLYSRVNNLQAEIDRERTRYEAFAALLIEASDDLGEAARRLEPVVRLIERIGSAMGGAKRAEEALPKLPPRKEQKQIEASNKKKMGIKTSLDNEIPF